MENSVRKESTKGQLTVDSIYVGDFQKEGTKTAQLRQVITTKSFYPSKSIKNNMQDNPFALADFGFEEQCFENTEARVAWLDIPAVITSVDDVLAKLPVDACLYKILSNRPILTNNQQYAIEQGLRSLSDFANSQVVRYGDGHAQAGQIVKDENGKPQYRAVFYSNVAVADQDLRTAEAMDFYANAAIQAELSGAGVIVDQAF